MYSWEKPLREEKPRKNPNNPSFSSTLLDEIYRSIDGNDEKDEDFMLYRERSISVKKHSQSNTANGFRAAKAVSAVEDEQMASLKRACLIEKWMEKQVHDKVSSRRSHPSITLLHDDDPLFFSTTSSSSDSSSGGLSSSDTEFFSSAKSSKSCFATVKKPKPVKTSVKQQQNDFFMDDYKVKQSNKTEEDLIKSKSRASKIYANLKKVKEPISPGGRLTSFINNLFTSGHSKKTKHISNRGYEEGNIERKSKHSTQASSTCSSASSFSRSCLSKTSPNSRAKLNDGAKRTVRFYPVSVILDEDCRPCGHKQIHDHGSDKFVSPPLSQSTTDAKKIEELAGRLNLKSCKDEKKDTSILDRMIQDKNFGIEGEILDDFDDEDDAASDCSSDLFEIDHLALFGKSRFREELPVYETTHLDTNRAIANGLIR